MKEIKNTTEKDLFKYHFGLGTWIRNNWLRRESNLLKYFFDMGIDHRDTMSSLIISTFWCKLNNKPDNLQERIKSYQERREAIAPPKDTTCPDCGYQIRLKGRLGDDADSIHYGYCQNDGSLWVFQRDKGWYLPPPDLIDLIER